MPDDEGPYQALWCYSYSAMQATAKVASAGATMDPMKLIDATPDLMKLLALLKTIVEASQQLYSASHDIKSVLEGMKSLSRTKGWYGALRYTDMLINAGAFKLLEMFIQQDFPKEDSFWCGLYAQLERSWVKGDLPIKDQVVKLIQRTIPLVGPKYRRAQQWIRLVSDNLGQPRWKDNLADDNHKLRVWKNKKYEPKLLEGFHPETGNTTTVPRKLLEKAWIECLEAQKLYADARISEYYIQGRRLEIKRLSGDLLNMDQCYINLALIERSCEGITVRSDDRKIESQSSAFTLFSRLKVEATDTTKNVSLPALFDKRKQRDGSMARPKRILIVKSG